MSPFPSRTVHKRDDAKGERQKDPCNKANRGRVEGQSIHSKVKSNRQCAHKANSQGKDPSGDRGLRAFFHSADYTLSEAVVGSGLSPPWSRLVPRACDAEHHPCQDDAASSRTGAD